MHIPFDTHLALAELSGLLSNRIRPAISDPELLDLTDAAIGLSIRLAIESGHPGVLPAAQARDSNQRAENLKRLAAQGDLGLLDAIAQELPELHSREAARLDLEARATENAPPMPVPTDDQLSAYLRVHFQDPTVSAANTRIVVGGNSKQTLLFDLVRGGTVEHLVMRRDFPRASNGKTVRDEFALLKALHASGFAAPVPIWAETQSPDVPGVFLVTELLTGRTAGNHDGPRAELAGPDALDMYAGALAQLHGLPIDDLDLPGYSDVAFDEATVLRTVNEARQRDVQFWDVREPLLELALCWLEANVAIAAQPKVIVHGDYGFHNIFEHEGRATVLDWEMAHPGAAAEDLCRARDGLGSWASFEDFLASYARQGGAVPPPDALLYYDVLRLTRSTINYRNAVRNFNLGIMATVRRLNATTNLYVRNLIKLAGLIEGSVRRQADARQAL